MKRTWDGFSQTKKLELIRDRVVVIKGRPDNVLHEGVTGKEHFNNPGGTRLQARAVLKELECHPRAPRQISGPHRFPPTGYQLLTHFQTPLHDQCTKIPTLKGNW